VRLIALLRDPVERAYSHHQMMSRTGRDELGFEEALAAEPERLAGLEEALMSETEQFLPSGQRAHHHHRHHAYFARGLYAEQLERWLEHFDREQLLVLGTEELLARPQETYAEVLGFLGLRGWHLDDFPEHNKKPYAAMPPEVRARLRELYAEPNARLVDLLGRDFEWATESETASARARNLRH
jgi:hypothetical protein